jgi:hypothetical protein
LDGYTMDSAAAPSTSLQEKDVTHIIDLIQETNLLLQRESDLSPANSRVTEMIGRLVHRIRLPYLSEEVHAVLSNPSIQHLHRNLLAKLSKAEYEAELFDSRHLCKTDGFDLSIITQLSTWSIYETLVGQELQLLHKLSPRMASEAPIVFVGSGPLPLSAIMLHLYGNVEVICLEIDSAACEASRELLQRIGLGDKLVVKQINGADFDYAPYRKVFVASLVTNKLPVLEQIRRTSREALVAVRTAEGMRQLMYEALDEDQLLKQGWQLLTRTRPKENLVINSTLFYISTYNQLRDWT